MLDNICTFYISYIIDLSIVMVICHISCTGLSLLSI